MLRIAISKCYYSKIEKIFRDIFLPEIFLTIQNPKENTDPTNFLACLEVKLVGKNI